MFKIIFEQKNNSHQNPLPERISGTIFFLNED